VNGDAVKPGSGPPTGAGAARRPRIVFCGGCNPHIDRGAVAAELTGDGPGGVPGSGDAADAGAPAASRGAAAAGFGEDETAGGDTTVYLSGCARACASDHRLTSDEPGEVVVAGETVDGRPTPARDLAATVRQKLKE